MYYLPLPDSAVINGPGHVEDSNELAGFVNELAAITKTPLDPFTPPAPGTSGHVAWHNTMVKNVKTVAAVFGVAVTLPPLVVKAGDLAHVTHHNLIRQALLDVSTKSWNSATGGTVKDVTNYLGTGNTYRVHTFTASGYLDVAIASKPFAVLCVGAGGAGGQGVRDFEPDGPLHGGGGGGGGALTQNKKLTLDAGRLTVTIGNPTTFGGLSANGGGAGGRGNGENYGHNGGTSGNGNPGGTQTITGYGGASGGGAGGAGVEQTGGAPAYSDVSGTNSAYGAGGNGGGERGGNGAPGYVIVAYQIA